MSNAIEIRNLKVDLGDFKLNNLNFNIPKGMITGFIGKNGSGKTTFIKAVSDILPITGGQILYDGIPMYGNEAIVKSKIGVVYDSLIYPLNYSPDKIVKRLSMFYKDFDMGKYYTLLKKFELPPEKNLSKYSSGMKMKFAIAMVMSQNPEILILDEPTSGLDPAARADILDLLLDFIQDENKSVFFSTHITSDLDKIADYIVLIDNGNIILSEEKDLLLDSHALVFVEKEYMTDEIRGKLSGLRETAFGFEGMCEDKTYLENKEGVRFSRPSVEDLLIFRGLDKAKVM